MEGKIFRVVRGPHGGHGLYHFGTFEFSENSFPEIELEPRLAKKMNRSPYIPAVQMYKGQHIL